MLSTTVSQPRPSAVAPSLAIPADRLIDLAVIGSALAFGTKLLPIVLNGGLDNSPVVRAAYFAVYMVFFGLLMRQPGSVVTALRCAPMLVLVLAFPAVSILWSIDPGETLERSVALLGSSLFAFYLALCLPLRRTVRLLAIAATLSGGLSLAAIVAAPSIGITQSGPWAGGWVGLHAHKNGLGTMSVLGTFLAAYAIVDARRRPWLRLFLLGGLLVNVLLLFGSRSLTSVLVFVAATGLAVSARMFQRAPGTTIVLALTAVTAVVAVSLEVVTLDVVQRVIEHMGRNSTLSSRLPIWELVWTYADDRLLAGYGYEAFWSPDRGWSRHFLERLGFLPFYSHNGFLELMLAGGVVLVGLVGVLVVVAAARGVSAAVRWRGEPLATLPLVLILAFLAHNITEASFLARNSMEWVLFVVAYLFLAVQATVPVRGNR